MMERRQSIRTECEFPSNFRNLEAGSNSHKICETLVKNISRGGICIRVDEFIPIRSPLYFYLQLPNHETIEVRLTPAWIAEMPNWGTYEMGACFVEMSAEEENAIQSFQDQDLQEKTP